jgi:hypothetical protein
VISILVSKSSLEKEVLFDPTPRQVFKKVGREEGRIREG